LAAFGFLIVVISTGVLVAIGGYVLIGFGCSCIVPVLFSASANIPGVSTVEGFAMVTTGGLIGFLSGPSLIGIISEKTDLSKGLSLLILLAIAAAIVAWRNSFLKYKNISGKKISPYFSNGLEGFDINNQLDYEYANLIIKKNIKLDKFNKKSWFND
jgi:MFS family permease